jgi:plasmid stabilization system protein ParE
MSEAKTTVVYSHVAQVTLSILIRYMSQFLGEAEAKKLARELILVTESNLKNSPQNFPICPELEMLGITDYRQITYKKYKVLFRLDTAPQEAHVMAFMRQKQSAQQLLIDYVIKAPT